MGSLSIKGDNQSLTKNNPQLSQLKVKFGWDAAELEMDKSVFLLDANGKVRVDEDFIFYNNPIHESGSVEYDEDSGDINVDFPKIPAGVMKIDFTLTIYDEEESGQNFSQITGAYISIIDAQNNKEILRFDLQENFSVETAVVVGEIYRNNDEWEFNAVAEGFTGGLEKLCENFGVTLQ